MPVRQLTDWPLDARLCACFLSLSRSLSLAHCRIDSDTDESGNTTVTADGAGKTGEGVVGVRVVGLGTVAHAISRISHAAPYYRSPCPDALTQGCGVCGAAGCVMVEGCIARIDSLGAIEAW